MKKKILSWLGVLLWMAVIYYFSSQPNLRSELEPFWDLIARKTAHMAEFFILAYLLFQAARAHEVTIRKSLIFALIIALGYAGFDEWHQGQVAGRQASLVDVGIDSVGVLVYVLLKFQQKPDNQNNP
jgi:VanZ family protein